MLFTGLDDSLHELKDLWDAFRDFAPGEIGGDLRSARKVSTTSWESNARASPRRRIPAAERCWAVIASAEPNAEIVAQRSIFSPKSHSDPTPDISRMTRRRRGVKRKKTVPLSEPFFVVLHGIHRGLVDVKFLRRKPDCDFILCFLERSGRMDQIADGAVLRV